MHVGLALKYCFGAELTEAMVLIGSPSDYANQIAKQADLATGKVFNCYRPK